MIMTSTPFVLSIITNKYRFYQSYFFIFLNIGIILPHIFQALFYSHPPYGRQVMSIDPTFGVLVLAFYYKATTISGLKTNHWPHSWCIGLGIVLLGDSHLRSQDYWVVTIRAWDYDYYGQTPSRDLILIPVNSELIEIKTKLIRDTYFTSIFTEIKSIDHMYNLRK